jgi:hypothetical protein
MTVRTRGSPWESLDRTMRCPQQDMGTPMWWTAVAHDLGELGEELAQIDVVGLAAQITTDAPHFAAAARRLPLLHERAQREVARLRREAIDLRGSPTGAREVHDAVEATLLRVRTLHRLCSDLLLDAYERDIGGD